MSATTGTARGHADILGWYEQEGIKLVRVSRKTKKPVDAGWQVRDHRLEEVADWVAGGGDVGWQVGEVSGWMAAADMDCEEAEKLAPRFLPATLRAGKGGAPSHYFYRSPGLGYVQFRDLQGEVIIDLKASENGAGHQIVVEPSVHRSKGPYKWVGGFNPAAISQVPKEELRALVGELAVAVLIARHLPSTGRHDLGMALAGYLLRNHVSPEATGRILAEAWEAKRAPREALRDLEGIVRDTAARLGRNEPTTGGRTLEELIPGLPARIAKFLGWEREDRRELRRRYERSDLGNAERFVDAYSDRVLWCPARGSFLVWDGRRFAWDERGGVVKLAHVTARNVFHEAAHAEEEAEQKAIAKWALASQNEGRINAMLSQAKPYLAVGMEELDRDPWLANCQNGTLDLKTGRLKDHDPADRITKIVPVDYEPGAPCPRFQRFLKEALIDPAVIQFVKRYAGYTLTGVTRERLLAILYGFGKNGKTTLVELLHEVLGDYARNTDVETLLIKRYQGVGNDVAALKGARFVSAAEVEKGRRLAESKVKQLTGRDTVTARFLFGENFDFKPEFKLWLSTNNKPVIQGTDDAIWDRIRLIPFTQRFEGEAADPKLSDKLRAERAGVLAWMVEGCLEWQEHGLEEPETVTEATKQYREEMDTLAAFIEERCVLRKDAVAPATPLYKQYQLWCDDAGEKPETQKMFGMRLRERGFASTKIKRGPHKDRRGWLGIGIRADDPGPEDPAGGDETAPDDTPNGSDGPPSGDAADHRPPEENLAFAGKTPGEVAVADDSGPKNQKGPYKPPRVGEDVEKRSASSASSADGAADDAIRALLEGPPDWLAKQLARCKADPERWLKPTAATLAHEAHGSGGGTTAAESELRCWLERGG